MKRTKVFSRSVAEAARLLGAQIRMGRTDRRWSADELADRLGISRSTVHKIERGDPTVGLGLALEAATIVGVALYSDSDSRRALELARAEDRLTLLPQRVRRVIDVDDDF